MLEELASLDALIRRIDRFAPPPKVEETPPACIEDHWLPFPGRQEEFFYSDCREVLYGGAAGGGKSASITALPLKWAHLPDFTCVIFRRETVDLPDLINKSESLVPQVYPGLSAVHSPFFKWTFPSKAQVHYRHLQKETSYKTFDGWEINLLIFDELTHFTEKQYKYLQARVRTADPSLPTLIRATTNPGGPGHDWVFKHWGAWLDPEFEAEGISKRYAEDGETLLPPARPGEVWWVRTEKGKETYYQSEPPSEEGRPVALSRTFIPALASDNPAIMQDVAYLATLEGLDEVRREQLLRGNWTIKPAAGRYFKREWVEFVDAAPTVGILARIRAWDLAGTEKKEGPKKHDPDYTSGTRMSFTKDAVYIEDQVRRREAPGEIRALIKATAELDGKNTYLFIPQDPGQAGKDQTINYANELRGWPVYSRPVTGSKIQRFSPFSAYADPRNAGGIRRVFIVRGSWNEDYLHELEAFPEENHDDQVDSTSDAFNVISEALAKQRKPRSGGIVSVNNSER